MNRAEIIFLKAIATSSLPMEYERNMDGSNLCRNDETKECGSSDYLPGK